MNRARQTYPPHASSPETCFRAGFWDPFDPKHTVTLDNPSYRWFGLSLMKGKLDWVLLRRLCLHGTAVGNSGYTLSDHKWLAADVSFT